MSTARTVQQREESGTPTNGTSALALTRRSWLGELGRLGIPIFLVLVVVVFSLLYPSSYGTYSNIVSILDQQAVVVLLAIAVTIPLIVGEFDLSAASNLALCAVLVIGLPTNQGLPHGLAIPIVVLVGGLIGLINATIVVRFKVNAFVGTLGMGTLLTGVWIWYLGENQTIITPQPTSFTNFGRWEIPGIDIPLPVIYALVIPFAIWMVLRYLPTGRRMYATGANRTASRLSGVRVDRLVMASFVASGLLAGFAGALLGAELGTANAGTGTELLLPAFAGAFLGATTIAPGRFNVWGVVVAIYALAFLISGLQQAGAAQWVTPIFNGGALIVAVGLSGYAFRSKAARARKLRLRQLEARAATEAQKAS